MAKCKSGKRARRDAAAKSAPDIKDADVDQKMKINQFPTRMEKRREKGNLRIQMFNRMKEEEELRKGMSIRDAFLQEQGIDVKEDEVKCEKYEFDAYKHAKKVQNGELIYPSRPASVGGGSVSSHHPVRTMMRKFTQKTITKVIAVLEDECRIEEVRKQVDELFEMAYSRHDPATRRAKAMMLKCMGNKYQAIGQREEKLCFLHPPRQNSAVTASKDSASSRSKAIMHNSLARKS